MNIGPVIHIVGILVAVLGAAMAVPAAVDFAAGNRDWQVFVESGALTSFVGVSLLIATRTSERNLDLLQGYLLTVACWLTLAGFAAVPLAFSGGGLDYADAFFEAMSGLTTTGSTVYEGLDKMPPGILLWRAMLQWFGGIGIIVVAIAILPFPGISSHQLFRLESSDKSEKMFGQTKTNMLALMVAYMTLTAVCASLLAVAGMSAFDAVAHAMTTISTGGFSTRDASIGFYQSPAIEWIIFLFMVLSALPFVLYVHLIRRGPIALWGDPQVRGLLAFLSLVIAGITSWLVFIDGIAPLSAFRLSAFNVTSIVTTTGFTSADYTQWGSLSIGAFFLLTLVGGCTGSTAGGIKIFRFQVLWIALRVQLWQRIYPHGQHPIILGGKQAPDDTLVGVLVFVGAFLFIIAVVSIALEIMGLDLITALTAAATAMANVGPGLGNIVGPAGSFGPLPSAAKWLLSFAMLVGRLEILTILVLFVPAYWAR